MASVVQKICVVTGANQGMYLLFLIETEWEEDFQAISLVSYFCQESSQLCSFLPRQNTFKFNDILNIHIIYTCLRGLSIVRQMCEQYDGVVYLTSRSEERGSEEKKAFFCLKTYIYNRPAFKKM